MFSTAYHFKPNELGGLDLDVVDDRVIWATGGKASSVWNSGYTAASACGPPAIYPEGGDRSGDDTLEVEARYLVLGDFAELRLRVFAQLVVLFVLLGLVAVGCLAFVV